MNPGLGAVDPESALSTLAHTQQMLSMRFGGSPGLSREDLTLGELKASGPYMPPSFPVGGLRRPAAIELADDLETPCPLSCFPGVA